MNIKILSPIIVTFLTASSFSYGEYSYPMEPPASAAPTSATSDSNQIEGGQSTANIVDTMTAGGINKRTTDLNIVIPGAQRQMTGYDEALYEHYLRVSHTATVTQAGVDSVAAFDVKKRQDELAFAAAEKAAKEKAEADAILAEDNTIRYGQAYCYLDKDITVERIATYAYFDCDFPEPIGRAQLAVSMVPEFYAKALIANPLYVVTRDNRRLPVSNGVVMTKDKNSVNLANVVNDRLLEKITIASGYKGVGVVATQAQAYLDAKSAARYQTTSTISGGLTPMLIQDTRVSQPNVDDYFATAAVQLVSEIAKIVGENAIQNLPYTFKVNKGNVYYADLQFSPDKNMEGYKIKEDTIIKQEPAFINGIQVPVPNEVVPVLNNHSSPATQGVQQVPNLNQSTTSTPASLPPIDNKGKELTFPTSTTKN